MTPYDATDLTARPLYFDYQATTPLDPRVLEAMMPYLTSEFGNPHSRTHRYGWDAEKAVEDARQHVAHILHADPKDIVLTSGATESNNLAIKGLAHFWKGKKRHIITTQIEHKCLLESCRSLEQEGFRITFLPVQKNGLIDLDALKDALEDDTLLVSVLAVHNEIGVVQPLEAIGKLCRARGIYFHTDAAQALGKIPLDVEAMNIDLLSLSGHKIYGPKGIGALYVRRKNPRVRLRALLSGGGQERNMRSGTLSPALCAGLGEACRLAEQEQQDEVARIQGFFDDMYHTLTTSLPEVFLNGDKTHRVPHNLNLSFAGVEGEGLMMGLKDLAISSGSACTSASLEPSYVLGALGVNEELAHTSLRISFGRMTTQEEVTYATKRIIEEVTRLRDMSPLWEMHLEGVDVSAIQWAH
ncbi:IscS subfamily cysteine desulfurase [bacterium NHP-B]|nr:IscS subfamily cysteine desulfurase [bacterium NHP-B]